MSAEKTAVLEATVPILPVADLTQAIDYYERVLGFLFGWKWGDPPHLASVYRDRVEVNLAQSPEAGRGPAKVYFKMAGVDAYYKQLAAAGARVAVPLADRPYGMRDFRIVDRDGNELSFGEPTVA